MDVARVQSMVDSIKKTKDINLARDLEYYLYAYVIQYYAQGGKSRKVAKAALKAGEEEFQRWVV